MTRRLQLGLLGFTLVILALLVVPLGVVNQRSERTDLTRRLERDAVASAALTTEWLRTNAGSATVRRRLTDYATHSGARVVVVDADGTSVLDTGESGRPVELGRDFATRPEVAAALRGRVDSGERGSDTLGHSLLFVAVPVSSGGKVLGAVRLSYPASELDARIRRYWLGLAAMSLAVLAVASITGVLLARWIARPLDRIASVARRVGAGELAARADAAAGPPEVRDVAARLNASLDAVESTVEEQRAFTADASHQLRTPLHALTLRLDNAAHALEGGKVDDAQRDVEHAAAEVDRLARLVEALLVLERADRAPGGAVEVLHVARVVESMLPAWERAAARAGVRIEVDCSDELVALAQAVHLEQVLDTFVDNAIAASPDASTVRILGRAPSRDVVELHVVDEGPGLEVDQLEAAFRRFHSSAERPRRGTHGGFGLGLSIARRLAQVDDGQAWLAHAAGGGIDAVVRYPSAMARETPSTRR